MAETCLGVEKSITGKTWTLRLDKAGERLSEAIAQQFGLPIMTARVLAGRGVTLDTAENFLNPSIAGDLPDPSILKDMDKAAKRLADAVEGGEKVAVFGDYDVDGATSSALLARYFGAVSDIPLEVYIPDRQKEGYGPNNKALLGLKERGASVVITVDCGTLAFEPLRAAKEAGLDVIVADHHKAETKLPEAFAVINPNRLDETGDLGNLAAAGVVYLLLVALNRELRRRGHFKERPEPDLLSLLDIVALGTVADVVSLTGLNRTFVSQGLKVMAMRRNIGINALSDVARLDGRPSAYHLGFLLGPRVNAGGRVGEASLGSTLLSTNDEVEAKRIALALDIYNSERQQIEAGVEEQASAMAAKQIAEGEDTLILVAAEDWHPGVIGIVAGRLREKFDLPAIVFSIDSDGTAKGSARSLAGVDIGAAVLDAIHHKVLEGGGGHAMAAGLTAKADGLEALKAFLKKKIARDVAAALEGRELKLDGVLAPKGVTIDLVETLDEVGPFGVGHPGPRFAFPEVRLVKADIVGKNHVRALFTGGDGGRLQTISFRSAEEPLGLALLNGVGKKFHVAGRIKANEWMGVKKADVTIEDAFQID